MGLEDGSGDRKRKREGLPAVQNLREKQWCCREKRGSNKLHEWVSTINEGKNPKEGAQGARRERGRGRVTPLGRGHQGGG